MEQLLFFREKKATMGVLVDAALEPIRFGYRKAKEDALGIINTNPINRRLPKALFGYVRANKNRISIIAVAIALGANAYKDWIEEDAKEKVQEVERLSDRDENQKLSNEILLQLRESLQKRSEVKSPFDEESEIGEVSYFEQKVRNNIAEVLLLRSLQHKIPGQDRGIVELQAADDDLKADLETFNDQLKDGDTPDQDDISTVWEHSMANAAESDKFLSDLRDEFNLEAKQATDYSLYVKTISGWIVFLAFICAIGSQVIKGEAAIEVK